MFGMVSKKEYNELHESLEFYKDKSRFYEERVGDELHKNTLKQVQIKSLDKQNTKLLDEKLELEGDLKHCKRTKVTLIQEINQLRKDLELADQTIKQYEAYINRLEEQ